MLEAGAVPIIPCERQARLGDAGPGAVSRRRPCAMRRSPARALLSCFGNVVTEQDEKKGSQVALMAAAFRINLAPLVLR